MNREHHQEEDIYDAIASYRQEQNKSDMKKVYISGKISGIPLDRAKAKFEAAANVIRENGHRPVNPFDNGLSDECDWKTHMKADIAMMMECDEVHMLPCWSDSRGATIEHDLAISIGMPVVYL